MRAENLSTPSARIHQKTEPLIRTDTDQTLFWVQMCDSVGLKLQLSLYFSLPEQIKLSAGDRAPSAL